MDTNVQPNNVEEHQYMSSLTQETTAQPASAASSPADMIIPHAPLPEDMFARQSERRTGWIQWFAAFKNVLPVYIATHLAFFVITCLSVLFVLKDFSWQALPTYTLWHSWDLWDSGIFTTIAKYGYTNYNRTAFFPLYPLLERALMYVTHDDPFIAGLVISDLAGLGIFVVLYRLVQDDFSAELAERTVLYLAIFPTAFYLASGYNESLFIFFSLMSFYQLRRGHWWLAGIFGFLASLTRSAGLLMLIPFCYEYVRQHTFQWKAIRWDVFWGTLIPAGLALFGVWCFIQYHDFLAFSHAQAAWNRSLAFPGYGIVISIQAIQKSQGFLSFQSLRNLTDLLPDLFILLFILLSFVGPWRFPRQLWAYGLYASILYIFLQLFPNGGTGLFPLESVGRFMLELFPAFIVMAAVGKYKTFHMSYLMVSGCCSLLLIDAIFNRSLGVIIVDRSVL